MNQFRGIFRLTYSGDAYIVLRTKVQVCTTILHLELSRQFHSGQPVVPQET